MRRPLPARAPLPAVVALQIDARPRPRIGPAAASVDGRRAGAR